MRQHPVRLPALSAVGALVVVAAILASAGGGRAASGNICNQNSGNPPTTAASCVTEIVSPHFIGSDVNGTGGNGTALSFTKFHNEAGPTGATASHVVLTVTFPDAVTVSSTTVWVAPPGSTTFSQIASTCTVTATTASCPAGNIPGDGRARMIVRFSGSHGGRLKGEAQYGEGGGNPSNPPNDDQINFDTLTFTTSASGGCFDLTGANTQTVTFTTALQQTQAVVGRTNDPSLPCTFGDTGVLPATPFGHTRISFVEFPTFLNNGYALVRMILTPVPTGFNLNNSTKSPVFEDTSYASPFFGTFITVPNCDRQGNLVGAEGTPVAGQTDPSPVNDSCVAARFSIGKGNGEIDLHVYGSPGDGRYSG